MQINELINQIADRPMPELPEDAVRKQYAWWLVEKLTGKSHIETNIRAVYLHNFFKEQKNIKDSQLMPYIEATLDHINPRDWYYALMDYGVFLKKMAVNPSRKSAHHAVQSTFQGSDRQIRGKIIKLLVAHGTLKKDELLNFLGTERERYELILQDLVQEKMVTLAGDALFI